MKKNKKRAKKSATSNIVSTLGQKIGVLALAFSLIGMSIVPLVAETASGYAISITTSTVGPFSVSIGGSASANPYVGLPSAQHVRIIDWGDSSAQQEATFNVTNSTTSPKTFTSTWSSSHTYAALGSYTITAAVCHQSCTGAKSADGTVTINVIIPTATLTVIKHVVNNNSGDTKTAADFTINVTGPSATPSSFPGVEAPGQIVSLDPGINAQSYSVSENPVSGYTGSLSADCSGTIASGQSKTCTITNTDNPVIVDTTPPVIAAHADITVEATSSAGAVVTYTPPNATDNVDATAPATCLPASGSTFPMGNTTVTCNKTDAAGNHATPTTFNVKVQDTTKPVITLNGNSSVSLHTGDTYTELGATATDNIDGDITAHIVVGGAVNTAAPGVYHVTFNVSDAAGNAANQVTRTVTVSDVSAPVINPIANITVEAAGPSGAVVTYGAVTATDDVDGTLPATCLPASGSTFPLGNTDVACSATDSSNNLGTGIGLSIKVQDTTAPVINLNGNTTINLNVGDTYAELGATATDIVDGTDPVTIGGDVVTTTAPATFHVTYDAVDVAHNPATQVVRTVIVSAVIPTTHTLTYTAGTNGTITGTSPQIVNNGSDGSAVTAVANTGFHFVNWNDSVTANPRTDTNVTSDISVTANFAANPEVPVTHTLAYTAGANGTITGTSPQIVNDGSDGSAVTAVANTGFHFVNWSDSSTTNPRTDTHVTADVSVTANFAADVVTPVTHTLTYTAGANGSITGTTPQAVNNGSDGSAVTAVADSGFHFVNWSDASTVNPRTDTNVTVNVSVTATFAADATLGDNTGGGGGGVFIAGHGPIGGTTNSGGSGGNGGGGGGTTNTGNTSGGSGGETTTGGGQTIVFNSGTNNETAVSNANSGSTNNGGNTQNNNAGTTELSSSQSTAPIATVPTNSGSNPFLAGLLGATGLKALWNWLVSHIWWIILLLIILLIAYLYYRYRSDQSKTQKTK